MGLLGGSSKSKSTQDTSVTSANQQGNNAPSLVAGDKLGITTTESGALSFAASSGGSNAYIVNNANGTDLAEIMGQVSIAALDYYDRQNARSLDIANEVAKATTSANKDIINEFANITEKSQSERIINTE
jgi:hypothetical protein